MSRTRGYLRYSDHKQDDGYSIEYQTTEIEQYAKRHNFNLLKLHIDQAQTGTKVAGREEFFALFDAVKAGEVDVVLVYKMNRLFRNSLESQKYRKLLRKHNVKLVSVTEAIDEDTSSGRLTTSILSDIDQYQSEIISDHVKSSMREMARQGFYTGGAVTYGFELEEISNGSKVRKKLKPLESEASTVRKIFELYAKDFSFFQIQDYLRSENLLTRHGEAFSIQQIARIIKSEVYIGTHRFKTQGYNPIIVKNCFEPIIDEKTWRIVQAKNTENKHVKPRRRTPNGKRSFHSLTGLIKCTDCGAHYIGYQSGISKNRKWDKKRNYYTCRDKSQYRSCKSKNIRKEYIEKVVLNAIIENILNEKSIKALSAEIVKLYDTSPEAIEKKLSKLKKQETKLIADIKKLVEKNLNDEISDRVYNDMYKERTLKLNDITDEIYQLSESKKTTISAEKVEAYLYEMLSHTSTTDQEILRKLFEAFVEAVYISETDIDIVLKVAAEFSAFKQTNRPPFVSLSAEIKRE